MKADYAEQEMRTALDVARNALEDWKANPTAEGFRFWRDASEIAIKWQREARREGLTGGVDDDELDKILR